MRTLERLPATRPASSENVLHVLDDDERRALSRIEHGAIARSALAGALSALVAAVAEVLVLDAQDTRPLFFWGVVLGVAGVASVLEIAFLSWDALRTVHAMSDTAGVLVDPRVEKRVVLTTLARAALEVPNPRAGAFAIDPHKETRKIVLLLSALAYKLKVSLTNVLLKQLVRRAMGRAAIRAVVVPFVAIPGTAVWNALVTAVVLREARVRIFGPSLARDVIARLLPPGQDPSPLAAEALLRAVGSCIVRTADLHPNLEQLVAVLVERLGGPRQPLPKDVDSSAAFLALLPQLGAEERALVSRMLRVAAVIDGRLARRERALLKEAGAWGDDDGAELARERRRVINGQALLLS